MQSTDVRDPYQGYLDKLARQGEELEQIRAKNVAIRTVEDAKHGPPIRSKEDVQQVLAEVGLQINQDPSLSDRDRRVLVLLYKTGLAFESTQVLCARRWMSQVTGLSENQCRDALPSLEKKAWITIRKGGPSIKWLRKRWMMYPSNRRPKVVELRQRAHSELLLKMLRMWAEGTDPMGS